MSRALGIYRSSLSNSAKQTGAFIERRTKVSGDGSDHDPAWVTLVILAPLAELAAALRNGQRGRAMRRACNYRSVMSTVGRSVLPDHPAA